LIVGYALLQPTLEKRFGISLPSFTGESAARTDSPNGDSSTSNLSTSDSSSGESVSPNQRSTQLKQIGRDTYETPAGLIYGRGSEHGTRIKHVMAHSRDEPNRPGQHGVFDADDQDDVLAIIDEAYEKAQRGEDVSIEKQNNRTVYEVDLGRRIGFVGGQSGNRRNRPAARHVRIVVEGNRLITAFPFAP
jgi:hypothetical protein